MHIVTLEQPHFKKSKLKRQEKWVNPKTAGENKKGAKNTSDKWKTNSHLAYLNPTIAPCCTLNPHNLFILKLKVCTLWPMAPISPDPAHGNHHSTLFLWVLLSFFKKRFHKWVKSYNICFSLSGLLHLALSLQVHPGCHRWQDLLFWQKSTLTIKTQDSLKVKQWKKIQHANTSHKKAGVDRGEGRRNWMKAVKRYKLPVINKYQGCNVQHDK